jgi:hypothetical protein
MNKGMHLKYTFYRELSLNISINIGLTSIYGNGLSAYIGGGITQQKSNHPCYFFR